MNDNAQKEKHQDCPICGKPRGKRGHEFEHGKCIEIRAQTEGKESAGLPGKLRSLTIDHIKKGNANRRIKQSDSDAMVRWLARIERSTGASLEYDFDGERDLVAHFMESGHE